MQRFTALYLALDSTTSTRHRVQAMQNYFAQVPAADAAWAVYFLAGGKPRQAVATRVLRETGACAAGMPDWLFDECYEAVGDLAETLALILPLAVDAQAVPDHHEHHRHGAADRAIICGRVGFIGAGRGAAFGDDFRL